MDVETHLSVLAREHAPRVIALLAGRFGDVGVADDAVQDALVEAATRWPEKGVPDNPAAWLNRVARRKAIDALRAAASVQRRTLAAAPELHADRNDAANEVHLMLVDDPTLDPHLANDELRLMFLCCHPALSEDSKVALTLRLVGGLTTEEIAAAFLVSTPTLAQRITRAKTKIRDARIPLRLPEQLNERLDAVLTTLYLLFNEGYLSRHDGPMPLRVDLCEQALRLTHRLAQLMPHHPEVRSLLALELFHAARADARFDRNLDLVLLSDQDRSQWDADLIAAGNAALGPAIGDQVPGRFQLQAMIAGYHANATDASATDWGRILGLYDVLMAVDSSPIVALNRAVAVSMVHGASTALQALDALAPVLDDYHLFHAVCAEMWVLEGRSDAAREGFERARARARNPAEVRHLARRLQETAER